MSETKFLAIRERYVAARAREEKYREEVILKRYASMNPPRTWLTRTEENKLDSFDRAQTREMDKMFDLLDVVGTRRFRSGVPVWWVMRELTYADATTAGPMSVVPPAAYGYTTRDAEAFAS